MGNLSVTREKKAEGVCCMIKGCQSGSKMLTVVKYRHKGLLEEAVEFELRLCPVCTMGLKNRL